MTVKCRSVLTVPGLEQHAVVVDSVSKRYSMCGARIGALVTRNQAVRRTAMKFAMARLSPPTLARKSPLKLPSIRRMPILMRCALRTVTGATRSSMGSQPSTG